MLSRLKIKNFALLRDMEIRFNSGFTSLTGETGSGKSLLVGAISFLIGGRADRTIIRDGAATAVVEGEFKQRDRLQTYVVRRELSTDGHNRAYVQDSPVTLKRLTGIVSTLVDITAQRAFSHLLEPSRHLDFLDRFAGIYDKRAKLAELSKAYATQYRRWKKLLHKQGEFRQRREFINFQLSEINNIDPQPGEDDMLNAEISKLEHFEEYHQNAGQFEYLLSGGDNAVISSLAEAMKLLDPLAGIDAEITELKDEFTAAADTLSEITRRISEKRRQLIYEPERLEKLRERHLKISGLVRKYGGSLGALLALKTRLDEELKANDESQSELVELEKRMKEISDGWSELAAEVSETRAEAAKSLNGRVAKSLAELGVKDARFEVDFPASTIRMEQVGGIEKCSQLPEFGLETAEFRLSTNPGIEPKPLVQVASGGELSRLLLTLKEVLPTGEDEAMIVFDEIDTGVSGRIARLVGLKLKKLAADRQLLAITHLPQIAALADHHLKVVKQTGRDATESEIIELKGADRTHELALLLSGGSVTEAAMEQARNLQNLEVISV